MGSKLSDFPLYRAARSGATAVVWLLPTAALPLLPGWAGISLVLIGIGLILRVELRSPVRRTLVRARPLSILWLTLVPVLAILTNLSAQPLYYAIMPAPPEVGKVMAEMAREPIGAITLLLAIAIYGPLVEEFAFRGHAMRTLKRAWGIWPAVATTAILFAVLHFSLWGFLFHVGTGLLYGYAVVEARSIWAPFAMHGASNAVNQIVSLRYGDAATSALPAVLRLSTVQGTFLFVALLVTLITVIAALGRQTRNQRRAAARSKGRSTPGNASQAPFANAASH